MIKEINGRADIIKRRKRMAVLRAKVSSSDAGAGCMLVWKDVVIHSIRNFNHCTSIRCYIVLNM